MSLNKRPRLGHGGDKDKFGSGFPWILCSQMPLGKRIVRGSPDNKANFWTFCPLKKFPKDRVKISVCEKCEHFSGYRKSFSDKVVKSLDEFGTPIRTFQRGQGISGQGIQKQKQQQSEQKSPPLDMTIIKPKVMPKKRNQKTQELIEADLAKTLKEKERKDKEWEEEEKRLQKGLS